MFANRSRILAIWVGLLALILFDAAAADDQKQAPDHLQGGTLVDAHWVKGALDRKEPLIIIDSRIEDEYLEGHLPGAVQLNADNVELYKDVLPDDKNQAVLFYCNGPKCLMSHKAAARAIEWGYRKVYWFRGGVPEWSALGFPLE